MNEAEPIDASARRRRSYAALIAVWTLFVFFIGALREDFAALRRWRVRR